MNLNPSHEDTLLADSVERILQKHSGTAQVRAAEPLGFDRELWDQLVAQGLPALHSGELAESDSTSLMPAVLVAEKLGCYLAAVPLIESLLCCRVLAECGDESGNLLADIVAGRTMASVALHDMGARPTQLVPGGAVADVVIGLAGQSVVCVEGFARGAIESHGSIAAQSLDFASATRKLDLRAPNARAVFLGALEEWKLLQAAKILSAAQQAVESAARYSRERQAFGKPIGAFQGVAHPLADSITDLDGGRLLVWRAAELISEGDASAAAMVSMAFWWAGASGRRATLRAMRVFGGYGVTMEYDAQLYYRKVHAWSMLAGPADEALDHVAARLWQGEAAALPTSSRSAIGFDFGPAGRAAADRMRKFSAGFDTAAMRRFMRESLDGFDAELCRNLAREGLLYPAFPRELGGAGYGAVEEAAIHEVVAEINWNLLLPTVTDMVWKLIWRFGSERAKAEILPRLGSAEAFCAIGFTEPSGGSDLFAARTSAVRDGDDWLINGQKMFTSTGHGADYCLMVVRTAPDKYGGLTLFVVPTRQPGYEVREIKTFGDERTNVTFYSDVRVPDSYRLGEVNGGTRVLAAALELEQSGGWFFLAGLGALLRDGLRWARTDTANGKPIDRVEVRRALAEAQVRYDIQRVLTLRCVAAHAEGRAEKYHGPMAKLFGSEAVMESAQRLFELAAPDALIRDLFGAGGIEFMARRSIGGTIYGGSSEIHRSMIAESALSMPRSRL